VDKGIELIGFGLNEVETPHRADYRYLVVWKIPEKKRVLTWFYVDVRCLCCVGIVQTLSIGISDLFILIPERIPSLGLEIRA